MSTIENQKCFAYINETFECIPLIKYGSYSTDSVFNGSVVVSFMIMHSLTIWVNELQMFTAQRSTNKLTIAIHVLYGFARLNFCFYVISMIKDPSLLYYNTPFEFPVWPIRTVFVLQKILDRLLYNLQSFEWLMYSNFIVHMSYTKIQSLEVQ